MDIEFGERMHHAPLDDEDGETVVRVQAPCPDAAPARTLAYRKGCRRQKPAQKGAALGIGGICPFETAPFAAQIGPVFDDARDADMPCPTDPPEALTALMPQMTRLALHLTGSRDQAQDLCQEVLLKLWMRLQAGHEVEDLRAYALAALRNQYRQFLRNQVPLSDLDEATEPTAPDAFGALAVHELETAIAALPHTQARLMRLVAAGETSPRALADITGWPLGTVMSRLARARARLRSRVGLAATASTTELL